MADLNEDTDKEYPGSDQKDGDNSEDKKPVTKSGEPVKEAAPPPAPTPEAMAAIIDIKFESFLSRAIRIKRLRETRSTIEKNQLLSTHDVEDLVLKVPGKRPFLSKESYTERRTKVGVDKTLSQLRLAIAKEEEELILDKDKYMKDYLDQIAAAVGYLQSGFVEDALDALYYNKTMFVGLHDLFKVSGDMVFSMDGKYTNIATTPIENLDFTKIEISDEFDPRPYQKCVNIMKELVTSRPFRVFIKYSNDVKPLGDAIDRGEDASISLSLCDLIRFFEMSSGFTTVNDMREVVNNLKSELDKNVADMQDASDTDKVAEISLCSIKLFRKIKFLLEVVSTIKPMNTVTITLTNLYKTLV